MNNKYNPQKYYTSKQLKMPIEVSRIIEITDPVYSFCEIMDGIGNNLVVKVHYVFGSRKHYPKARVFVMRWNLNEAELMDEFLMDIVASERTKNTYKAVLYG